MENIFILISIILSSLGLIGSIIPALPGPILSYVALFLLYFIKGNNFISEKFIIISGLIVMVIMLLVNLIPIATLKMTGGSHSGIIGSVIGMILGLLLFPPLGIFIGAVLGAIIGELYVFNNLKTALNAGIGTVIGVLFVFFIQISFSFFIFIYIISKILNIL